jgi:hypothetical protein
MVTTFGNAFNFEEMSRAIQEIPKPKDSTSNTILFLDLPFELRREIYRELYLWDCDLRYYTILLTNHLRGQYEVQRSWQSFKNAPPFSRGGPACPMGLLVSCKQIYQEAMQTLYGENRLVIDISRSKQLHRRIGGEYLPKVLKGIYLKHVELGTWKWQRFFGLVWNKDVFMRTMDCILYSTLRCGNLQNGVFVFQISGVTRKEHKRFFEKMVNSINAYTTGMKQLAQWRVGGITLLIRPDARRAFRQSTMDEAGHLLKTYLVMTRKGRMAAVPNTVKRFHEEGSLKTEQMVINGAKCTVFELPLPW